MATALDKTGLSKMLCFMQGKVYETRHVEGECTYLRHNKSLVLTDSRPLPSATSSGQIASSPRKLRPLRSRLAKFGSALAPAQARVCSCWPGRPRLTRIARQASREAGSSPASSAPGFALVPACQRLDPMGRPLSHLRESKQCQLQPRAFRCIFIDILAEG